MIRPLVFEGRDLTGVHNALTALAHGMLYALGSAGGSVYHHRLALDVLAGRRLCSAGLARLSVKIVTGSRPNRTFFSAAKGAFPHFQAVGLAGAVSFNLPWGKQMVAGFVPLLQAFLFAKIRLGALSPAAAGNHAKHHGKAKEQQQRFFSHKLPLFPRDVPSTDNLTVVLYHKKPGPSR